MKEYYDVIIVGTGAAGLYCALNLPERKRILLITKQEADQSDSFLAQGGICMLRGEDDYQNYFEDTMRAGHYENNARAVDLMIRSSNSVIRDLVERKVDFTRDETGNLMFTREAAHSQPRILFHEDITGKQITQTLLNEVKTKENIEICEYMTMVDLIEKDNVCRWYHHHGYGKQCISCVCRTCGSGLWRTRRIISEFHKFSAHFR